MSAPTFAGPPDAEAEGGSDIKWFAGLAMQAIIVKQDSVTDSPVEREEVALWAWRMAEAMAAMEKQIRTD